MGVDSRRSEIRNYSEFEFVELTRAIIGCAFTVHGKLGRGFLEKVYANSLAIELEESGFRATREAPVDVLYRNRVVGAYYADILVNDLVIVEIKAAQRLAPEHEAQLINYLKATSHSVGLLLNFGTPSLQVKRLAFGRSEQNLRNLRESAASSGSGGAT
ncbi:MAG TPA: GxxExxY protein [Dehalococcoidia bacterium]|jgi:GxxExxY protein